MSAIPIDRFIRDFSSRIDADRAAIFCGAGTSIGAGMPDWKGLMTNIARDLDLDVAFIEDLPEVAQFNIHANDGSRADINERIVNELNKIATPGLLHDALVRLPVSDIWTTNYDTVLENAYRKAGLRVDVKTDAATIAVHRHLTDVTIYKMHGDVQDPDHAVVTKDDYDRYERSPRGRAFLNALEAALAAQTFLFIGFSFSDPNLEHVLSEIASTFQNTGGKHYTLVRTPPAPYAGEDEKSKNDRRLTELRVESLRRRFKIHTVYVDSFEDVANAIARLGTAARRNKVFVSGAADEYSPMGEQRLTALARALGARLLEREKTLVNGFGKGLGQLVIEGYFTRGYEQGATALTDRAVLRPFPQRFEGTGTRDEFWMKYRTDMISKVAFSIYIAGNKEVDGKIVLSDGVRKEFEIARRLNVFPIPIGATGSMAKELWEEVASDLEAFGFVEKRIRPHFAKLNDENATNNDLLDACFAIMEDVSSHLMTG